MIEFGRIEEPWQWGHWQVSYDRPTRHYFDLGCFYVSWVSWK